ncbi:MAG TPA: hypothetical protein VIV60_24190, partial [Polyangiaceae bacterium]
AYQTENSPGVVEALLRRVEPLGWSVVGATPWKSIRKYRGKGPNVLGLVEMASRADAAVVAFVRDADNDAERQKTIASAIEKAAEAFPKVAVIGGSAIQVLEAWILAMQGEHGTEQLRKASAQAKLKEKGLDKDTARMTQVVTEADLVRLPRDAESLNAWLDLARKVLSPLVRKAAESAATAQ